MQHHKQKIKSGETLWTGEEQTKQFRETTLAVWVAESELMAAAFYLARLGDTLDGA